VAWLVAPLIIQGSDRLRLRHLTVTCADSKDFCHSGALQSGFGGGEKREQAVIGMACISMILPKVTAV
jgi:hypothetical protein